MNSTLIIFVSVIVLTGILLHANTLDDKNPDE
jgi:fumarate reductase subunit C